MMKQGMGLAVFCIALAGCNAPAKSPTESVGMVAGSPTANVQTPLQQINAIRASAGRKPVVRSAKLDAAARAHAIDMVANGFYGHIGSNGSTVADRVSKAGYRWCSVSENIAQGSKYDTEGKVIQGWKASPGHHRNIVNPKARAFGMAKHGGLWVQVIAGDRC